MSTPTPLTRLLDPEVAAILAPWTRATGIVCGPNAATLVHDEGGLHLAPPRPPEEVAYTVELSAADLHAIGPAGPLSPLGAHALHAAWLWPVTWWTLRRRRTRDWILQLGVEIDNVIHLTLQAPDGGSAARTWLNLNAEWAQVQGHVFRPSLRYRWSTDDMREWLREIVAATTARDDLFWEAFTGWYSGFRARTGDVVPNARRAEALLAELARYDHWDEEPEPEPDPDWGDDDWGEWE